MITCTRLSGPQVQGIGLLFGENSFVDGTGQIIEKATAAAAASSSTGQTEPEPDQEGKEMKRNKMRWGGAL